MDELNPIFSKPLDEVLGTYEIKNVPRRDKLDSKENEVFWSPKDGFAKGNQAEDDEEFYLKAKLSCLSKPELEKLVMKMIQEVPSHKYLIDESLEAMKKETEAKVEESRAKKRKFQNTILTEEDFTRIIPEELVRKYLRTTGGSEGGVGTREENEIAMQE